MIEVTLERTITVVVNVDTEDGLDAQMIAETIANGGATGCTCGTLGNDAMVGSGAHAEASGDTPRCAVLNGWDQVRDTSIDQGEWDIEDVRDLV